MRHRIGIAGMTGLGNSEPARLSNQWTGIEEIDQALKPMMAEAVELFFKDWEGCDFSIAQAGKGMIVTLGIEPSYKFDTLKIIAVGSCMENSYKETGVAWGYFGTGIASTVKTYAECTYKTAFTRFVQKWSEELQKIASEYLPIEEE